MGYFDAPRPLYRWQLGLLWLSRARSLIPRSLAHLPPGGADKPLPNPGGNADPRQAGRLADQLLLLGEHAEAEGDGLRTVCLGSGHAIIVGLKTLVVKLQFPS
jgi:hypothetical protein